MASTQSERDEETTTEDAQARADAEHQHAGERAEIDETAAGANGAQAAAGEAAADAAAADEGKDDETVPRGGDAGEDSGPQAGEGAPAAASASKRATAKGERARAKEGLTPGARLAAAKAAKAARKAAKRGKEKKAQDPLVQVRESELAKRAEQAGAWATENRNVVLAVAVVLIVAIGGWLGWSNYQEGQNQAAGALLAEALEIASAEIVAPPEGESSNDTDAAGEARDEDEAPTFPTAQARAEAALEAYRRVLAQYPSSDAAVWARLGEARALADLGRNDEAREAYEAAEREGGSDPMVAWRAIEGRAFLLEAQENWDGAMELYEQLKRVDRGRYEPVATYHVARMQILKGERQRATETLRTLVEQLGEAEDDEEKQDFAYVQMQAQERLRELDPSSAVPAARPSALGGRGGMSDEQLRQLIQSLQKQQGGGAE